MVSGLLCLQLLAAPCHCWLQKQTKVPVLGRCLELHPCCKPAFANCNEEQLQGMFNTLELSD